jgi:hypothetical protein
LVDPFFPLETVLIGKQMGFPAASGNAVIPTTYGRIDESEASFSHGKSPSRNIQFILQNLPNCKTNAICCACPFLFFQRTRTAIEMDLLLNAQSRIAVIRFSVASIRSQD